MAGRARRVGTVRSVRTPDPRHRVTVVVMTRDRRESLARTLTELTRTEPTRTELTRTATGSDRPRGGLPPVVVVDNGSADGTPDLVADRFPAVRLVTLPSNAGAMARNVGVALADTPYVAFSDDDSWWAPGALTRAADLLDAAPRLGVLVAQVRLPADGTAPGDGTDSAVDPASVKAGLALLGHEPDLPGPSVAGFPACAAVVRRSAFLAAGGFSPVLGFGGEEELLSLDLAAAGWGQAYAGDVVAVHAPDSARDDADARWALQQRNSALTAWLRLPTSTAVRATGNLGLAALRDRTARPALWGLVRRLPRALGGRRQVPTAVADAHARAGRPVT